MRYLMIIAATILAACAGGQPAEGAGKPDEQQLAALQEQIDELADALDAAEAQIDAMGRTPEPTCTPKADGPVIGHAGNGTVLFSGECAASMALITVTVTDEFWDSTPMDRIAEDLWLGYARAGRYRLMVTRPDGSVECYPGPDCDTGHFDADDPPPQ